MLLTLGGGDKVSDSVMLSYRYRVVCDAGYYGAGCSTSCLPRNDKFGHYACDNNGLRICDAGWTGQYCDRRKAVQLLSAERPLSACRLSERRQEGLAVASIARDVVVEMNPPRDDSAR